MKLEQSHDDQARVYAQALRRVAVASVLALAVVLPLAVITAQHEDGHRGNSVHSAGYHRAGRPAAGPASD
ncbi:hypothetical protein [Streptomyces sp. NBC_01190]|uniref:hypothetical protein n=1 Tax=Streptomyces sp. NBC_01190 TaxID=2903767 RepID=UPI0038649D92|nr:hypothetical protein OG519_16385 [Streptomyces sp. NBC_01190]